MSWRVLVTAPPIIAVGQDAVAALRKAGCEIAVSPAPGLAGCDAVIAGVERYGGAELAAPDTSNLKIISRWGVGYDSIDIAAATGQGIVVAYTPGLLNEAVADYAFALLCALARGVHLGHVSMAQGQWEQAWGGDIFGKTLGIIGCGRIGQAVARRAVGFQMRVLAFDPSPGEAAGRLGVEHVSLETLLAESDFVSVHAALTPQTRGLLGASELKRMKPTAYLINTARGALLDEAALAHALSAGTIAGAALDCFAVEPLPAGHVFHRAPNLLLTPHQASCARETAPRSAARRAPPSRS